MAGVARERACAIGCDRTERRESVRACALQNYTLPLMGFLPLYLVPLSALYALSLRRSIQIFPFFENVPADSGLSLIKRHPIQPKSGYSDS